MFNTFSDLELARMLMGRLNEMYDSGGHSSRSDRAQLLEAAMPHCKDRGTYPQGQVMLEATIRNKRPFQPGLFPELEYLSTEELVAAIVRKINTIVTYNPDPPAGIMERELIRHLVLLLRLDRWVLPDYDTWALVQESRNREHGTLKILADLRETARHATA